MLALCPPTRRSAVEWESRWLTREMTQTPSRNSGVRWPYRQNFTAHYHLGEIAIASGRPQRRHRALSPPLPLKIPATSTPASGLPWPSHSLAHPDEAMQQLREAANLAPNDAVPHALLSQMLTAAGRLQEAIAEQRTALRLAPQDPDGME